MLTLIEKCLHARYSASTLNVPSHLIAPTQLLSSFTREGGGIEKGPMSPPAQVEMLVNQVPGTAIQITMSLVA